MQRTIPTFLLRDATSWIRKEEEWKWKPWFRSVALNQVKIPWPAFIENRSDIFGISIWLLGRRITYIRSQWMSVPQCRSGYWKCSPCPCNRNICQKTIIKGLITILFFLLLLSHLRFYLSLSEFIIHLLTFESATLIVGSFDKNRITGNVSISINHCSESSS